MKQEPVGARGYVSGDKVVGTWSWPFCFT